MQIIGQSECKDGLQIVIDGVTDWMNKNEDKLKSLGRKFIPDNFQGKYEEKEKEGN